MPGITELWLPILLFAVILFLASWVLHVFMPHHKGDYPALPNEDAALAALRQLNLAPGNYFVPRAADMKAMKDPAFIAKMKQGPQVLLHVSPGSEPGMGKMLGQWFIMLLVVGVLVAYVASRTLPAGSDYLAVFRVVGAVTFLTLAGAHVTESIWYARRWRTAVAYVVDGLIYGLLAGGVFGWLWPAAAAVGGA